MSESSPVIPVMPRHSLGCARLNVVCLALQPCKAILDFYQQSSLVPAAAMQELESLVLPGEV
jgi:hypothetical protein